jgi:FSR family fosmidomycin resistance protein-like MFS transporter
MVMGMEKSYLAAIPGLIFVGFLLRGGVMGEKLEVKNREFSLSKSFRPQAKAIGLLFVIVVLWTAVRMGFIALLPILYAERGFSLLAGGGAITVFAITGAAGGLVGGHMSDRVGRKTVILIALLISVPFLFGFVNSSGPLSVVLLALAGTTLMASNSVVIAMAQELIPENAGTASSIVMGLAWGVGGMLVFVFGMAAEKWGTPSALAVLSFVPITSFLFALFLPEAVGAALATEKE